MTKHGLTGTEAYKTWDGAKQRARTKKLPFEITVEFVHKLFKEAKSCPICCIALKHNNGRAARNSPSLDRLVPDIGYIERNVNAICQRCNAIKNSGTAEEHRRIAEWIDREISRE